MKKYIILIFLFVFQNTFAQTYEEYKKQEKENLQKLALQQDEELAQMQKEFVEYVEKRDQEWIDYLKKEWENYSVFKGEVMPKNPKPKDIPSYIPTEQPPMDPLKNPDLTPIKPIMPKGIPIVMPPALIPLPVKPIRKPIEAETDISYLNIQFYGRNFSIPFDKKLSNLKIDCINQENITDFWDNVSQTNYSLSIEALLQAKIDLNINDYGFLIIVQEFTQKLYPHNQNLERLLSWFILVRSGYGAKVAFNNSNIALLIPSLQKIFEKDYLEIFKTKYYFFPELEETSFFTYKENYPSTKFFDFSIYKPIRFLNHKATRQLIFDFEDTSHEIEVNYDPELINFYKNYPWMEIGIYLNAAVSGQAKESMALGLKPLVENMDELQAVNLLLRFVQTAFEYKTDPEQFGREKYFFAEELFHYPYCDCEDRSVLFSYLVRELLGLKVIGLEYPGHMATAVSFTSSQSGNYLTYNNNQYIVADPTYINAPVGLVMPNYKSESPTVHEINTYSAENNLINENWHIAEIAGINKSSNINNSKIFTDGSFVLTGSFSNKVKWGNTLINGFSDKHNCIVAKLDSTGKPEWAQAISASENSIGISIEETPSKNIIAAGVFSGSLLINGNNISTLNGKSDLFIACFSPNGKLLWINQANLDSLPQNSSLKFSVVFNNKGVKNESSIISSNTDDLNQGLFIDESGTIIINGYNNYLLNKFGNDKSIKLASVSERNVSELLTTEIEKLINQQIDGSIAGLMAVIRLVKDMGISLSGVQVQQLLDKFNPDFKTNFSNVYEGMGKVQLIKNNNGFINIQTLKDKDITFKKLKISDNSNLSVTEITKGDYRIDILSGIFVGKLVVWYNLNYIKTLAKNGDLLFDFDTDHSQALVNIKKDLLY